MTKMKLSLLILVLTTLAPAIVEMKTVEELERKMEELQGKVERMEELQGKVDRMEELQGKVDRMEELQGKMETELSAVQTDLSKVEKECK